MILIGYKHKGLRIFGDGEYENIYEMTLLKSYFFGLIKVKVKVDLPVSMFTSLEKHEQHFNKLIRRKTKI